MKSRIARAGLIAAEIAGVAVAALLGVSAFIAWRAQSGPVELGWARPLFKSAANAAAFEGAVRRIGDITLESVDEKGGYRLTFTDVRLGNANAEATARVPLIAADLYPHDFLTGKAGPRRLVIDGAELRIVRRTDRRIRLDFGEASGDRANVVDQLTGGAFFRDAFERAELNRIRINFTDEVSGRTWRGDNAAAFLARSAEGYEAGLTAAFDISGIEASVSFAGDYSIGSDRLNATLDLQSAPVGDLLAIFYDAPADLFTSLVSGRAGVRLRGDGTIIASAIDLTAGAGALRLGKTLLDVEEIGVRAGFDPTTNAFAIERASVRSPTLSGAVSGAAELTLVEGSRKVSAITFDLEGERFSIAHSRLFPTPLGIESATLEGRYSLIERALALQSFGARLNGLELAGSLSYQPGAGASPAVNGTVRLDGAMDVPQLLSIWPERLAEGARRFVSERINRGSFSNLDFRINLPAGAVGGNGVVPDDAMALSFRADGAEVVYAPGMTPLKGVSGRGVLKGNSFRFEAEKGETNGVAVTEGLVDIPVIAPKGELAHFSFRARGDAENVMQVLAEPPLAILKETKLTPKQFAGLIDARVKISRPNLSIAPEDSYRYEGTARFSGLRVDAVFNDVDLEKASGVLTLRTDGLGVIGKGALASAPVSFEWRQKFRGGGDKTWLALEGVADPTAADLFGLPMRQLVQGDVAFKAIAKGDLSAFRTLDVDADFANAAILVERLGWMKPRGVPAAGSALLTFRSGGVAMSTIRLKGEGVSIEGDATIGPGGRTNFASLPVFQLKDGADIALSAARNEAGVLEVTATGRYLNAGAMVREIVEGGPNSTPGTSPEPLALTARLERLDLRNGVSWRDASLDFKGAGAAIETLHLSAIDETNKPLSVTLRPTGEGAITDQVIDASTENIGGFMSGVFGLSSIRGGRGRLSLEVSADETSARAGAIEASGVRVVNAPLLAKIFSAGSLSGLADLMNGDGIELSEASAAFSLENGRVRLSKAHATGPSVGITAQGSFGFGGAGEYDLSGAVAPAYGVNSILGRTPVIGDLFVNRKGEGLVAISYTIDGPASEPRVTVNPLSALAPGVFRRMFETGRSDPPTE